MARAKAIPEVEVTQDDPLKAIKALDASLTKKFGDKYYGISNKRKVDPVTFVSTGCFTLDAVFGGGQGIPSGRIIELFGPPSAGKGIVGMAFVKAAQQAGKCAAWVDVEAAWESNFAEDCGVDESMLALLQPHTCEEALEGLREFVKSGVCSVVVLDSIGALSAKAEQDKNIDEATMAVVARYLSRVLRELAPVANNNGTTILLINQVRTNIGGYGSPEVTPGGAAPAFFASVRARISRKEILKKGSTEVGILSQVRTVKNKVAQPFIAGELYIYFPHIDPATGKRIAGIDYVADLVKAGLANKAFRISGAWIYFMHQGEEVKFQGELNLANAAKEDPDLLETITNLIRATPTLEINPVEDMPVTAEQVIDTTKDA